MKLLLQFFLPCTDEPDAPGAPEAEDWDKDHIDLVWTKPDNDGGAPITGYVIEKKEKFSLNFIVAGETFDDKTSYTVRNLTEEQEYLFRVKAVNKAGPSQPSDASKPVVAKPRFGTFDIHFRIKQAIINSCLNKYLLFSKQKDIRLQYK